MSPKALASFGRRLGQTRILRLTQMYRALSEVNQAILRMGDEAELFPLVCRVAVEFAGVRMAWIGQLEPGTERIVPVQSYGEGTDYLQGLVISARDDCPEGRGPSATALRENRPVLLARFATDPMAAPWHSQARRFGWGSSGAFPISRGGRPTAVLSVYHREEDFFDDETVKLLQELSTDIGFALDNFDRERDRKAALEALRISEEHFRAYFERSMVGMAATRPDHTFMETNEALWRMLGYSESELATLSWSALTHPDDLPHNEAMYIDLLAGDIDEFVIDKRFIRKDGSIVYAHVAARAVREADGGLAYVVALVEDITSRKRAEAWDRLRNRVLERMARGASLPETLDDVVRGVESAYAEVICTILLLDETGKHVRLGAAPSLPDFYNEAFDGAPIGPAAGSCGTAAYTGKRVIVEDIATHPYWDDYRELAARAGLASCWSEPILSASGSVLGTFAIYQRKPSAPTSAEIALIENAANLVGLAIERRQFEEERHVASLIYDSSSEAMVVTDTHYRLLACNPAFTKMYGYELEEVRGDSSAVLLSNRHDESFFHVISQEIEATGGWQGEIWARRKNGEIFPVWLTINVIRDDDGSVHRYLVLGSDITNKVRSDELIWRQANFDFLTDLPNRYMLHDRLEQEVHKAHRDKLKVALLYIDLDRFKDVNDSLGHQVGDELLVEAAGRIQHCVREVDTVARLGGDEFMVILTQLTKPDDAELVAQHILSAIAEPFMLKGDSVYISASIGITFYPDDSDDVDKLIANADQAMYAAKSAGRNQLDYFTPALHDSMQQRLKLTADLRGALAGSQFELQFQPIVSLPDRAIVKAEALLRWRHPDRGLIAPVEFIPLAEETGLIVSIGDWVFRESARYARHWSQLIGSELQISVNTSPVQFQSEELSVADWREYLRELGISGSCVSIEITEGLLLNARPEITEKLLAFRDSGIQVAIDDFGTGYSALSYLNRFDIDYLKIDRAFISSLETDPNDRALSEAMIIMAHRLGLRVIAEGVETDAQCRLLAEMGCDYGQGYLFSKPLPPEEFERMLVSERQSASGL